MSLALKSRVRMASEAQRCSRLLNVCSTMFDSRSAMALQVSASTASPLGGLDSPALGGTSISRTVLTTQEEFWPQSMSRLNCQQTH